MERGVLLSSKTTLGLGGPAKRYARVTGTRELVDALADATRAGERVLVLGGGSNLVVSDAGWDGLVIEIATRGVRVSLETDHALVTACAGEPWDDFVARV